jgi:hypothetical protein
MYSTKSNKYLRTTNKEKIEMEAATKLNDNNTIQ